VGRGGGTSRELLLFGMRVGWAAAEEEDRDIRGSGYSSLHLNWAGADSVSGVQGRERESIFNIQVVIGKVRECILGLGRVGIGEQFNMQSLDSLPRLWPRHASYAT
jgi:hypothetical protein